MSTAYTHLILQASAMLAPGTCKPPPPKPWRQLSDKHPSLMPPTYPKDTINHRYATIQTPRIGALTEEQWTVQIAYARHASETLHIRGYAHDASAAGTLLEHLVEEVREAHRQNVGGLRVKYTFDRECTVIGAQYVVREERRGGAGQVVVVEVWYWWDVMRVELGPMKTYEVGEDEGQVYKEWVEDMEDRFREGMKMVRRSQGRFTEDEREAIRWRNRRLGVVDEEQIG